MTHRPPHIYKTTTPAWRRQAGVVVSFGGKYNEAMETPTNNLISSNTVPEFSWKDYWKVFFIVLGGGVAIFLATFVYAFFDFNDVDKNSSYAFFVSFYFILIAPTVMGEAFLALILSMSKVVWGISLIFVLHTLAYLFFPGLLLLSIFWSGGDLLRDLPEFVGTVGSVIFTAYGFIRTEHYRRKKFDKYSSLPRMKRLLAHPLKFCVKLFVVLFIYFVAGILYDGFF